MSTTVWLTIKDLTARFQLSRAAIYSLIQRGQLPKPHHFGRSARWTADDIFAAEQRLISAARGGGEA